MVKINTRKKNDLNVFDGLASKLNWKTRLIGAVVVAAVGGGFYFANWAGKSRVEPMTDMTCVKVSLEGADRYCNFGKLVPEKPSDAYGNPELGNRGPKYTDRCAALIPKGIKQGETYDMIGVRIPNVGDREVVFYTRPNDSAISGSSDPFPRGDFSPDPVEE